MKAALLVSVFLVGSTALADTTAPASAPSQPGPILAVGQVGGMDFGDWMLYLYADGRVIRKRSFGYHLDYDLVQVSARRLRGVVAVLDEARRATLRPSYAHLGMSDQPGLLFRLRPDKPRIFVANFDFHDCKQGEMSDPAVLVRLCQEVGAIKRLAGGTPYHPDLAVTLVPSEAHPRAKPWPPTVPAPHLAGKTRVEQRYAGRYRSAFENWGPKHAPQFVELDGTTWTLSYDPVMPGE